MASFGVHLMVGMGASGLAATALHVDGVIGRSDTLWLFALGTLGSLLPDLDADNSTPLRIAFNVLSLLGAFLLMFQFVGGQNLAELTIIWAIGFGILRYGVFWVFTYYTTHRGIFHSIPATLLAGLLTAIAARHALGQGAEDAWLSGLFVSLGYLIHLLLDEFYSVNLMGVSLKQSFGSALKPFMLRPLWPTLLVYVALLGALFFTPPLQTLGKLTGF